MAGEVIAPPVRVLDFGYQAPNPLDYARIAQMQTQPLQEAVNNAMEAKKQFLLSQIQFQHEKGLANLNAQKAFQLAQWQHGAQIQREQMRDERMMQVAKLRAQAQLDALKEKGALDDVKAKSQYLSRIGGGSLARQDGESDTAYGQRLDDAIKNKMTGNIQTDAKAAYSIQKQISAYNNYLNDPRVSGPVANELQAATANAGVRAQAQNAVDTGFDGWLDKVAGENAPMIQDALQKAGPQNRDLILQRAGLKDAFNAYQQSALQQSAYAYLKATGSPAVKQMTTANENLGILKQQLQNISMMPGDNGRMVPKSWWPEVQNTTNDMLLHERLAARPMVAPSAAPPAPASVTPPVVAPSVARDPYADYRSSKGSLILPGTDHPNPVMPPQPVALLSAADAAHWGLPPPPVIAPPSTNANLARFGDGSPVFQFPPAAPPAPVIAPPAAVTNSVVPPMPALQPIPAAVRVSAPIPSNPVVMPMNEDASAPYDQVMQMMQMRNLYSQ